MARTKDTLQYYLPDTLVPEENSCKYLRIILFSDLSWGGSSKLYGKKGMESTTLYNVDTQNVLIIWVAC